MSNKTMYEKEKEITDKIDVKEAIKMFQNLIFAENHKIAENHCRKLAIEALEKQIPKKPIEKDIGKLKIPDTAFCPTCGNPVIKDEADNYEQAYCCYCGQAIGWSVKKKF